jgi:hypothetical protein
MTSETQRLLEKELEKLKRISHQGYDLHVRWFPSERQISGELKNNIIFIYDFEESVAVDTLYHEFIEYIVTKAIEPYQQMANKLIEFFNENAYITKEKSIQGIANLMSNITER